MKKRIAWILMLLSCILTAVNCAFAEAALPAAEAAVEESGFFQGIIAHMTGTISVFGIVIPYYFIYFAGLIVLAVIILVILAATRKDKAVESDDSDNVLPPAKKNEVKFVIQYKGSVESVRREIEGTLRIGRELDTLPLNPADHSISRKHCELYFMNDVLMLRDFSSNGTVINGTTCSHSEQIINNGDKLTIGEHVITVNF